MKHLEELREILCVELDKFAKSGDVTANTLDKIHKLTDTIKNIDKIQMLEDGDGYSGDWMGEGRMYGNSYARGRRGNVKRDSMGRYSRDTERGMRDGDYSREDAKEQMLDKIGEMMENADPKEREALKECMRAIERA